jgi:hypothetical protein
MTRDQIIETMARAMCEREGYEPETEYLGTGKPLWRCFEPEATAALSALEAAGLAVVPTDATEEQLEAAIAAMRKPRMRLNYTPADDRVTLCVAYKAMTTAAQGAHKP